MECSPVTHDRNKGQLWTTQSGQLCFLTCLTQNKEVELGRGVLLIQTGKLRLRGTGDSFQVTHQLKDS